MPDYHDLAALDGRLGLGPRERASWREGTFDAVRMIECAWTDRVAVYNSLLGTTYPYIGLTGTQARAIGGEMIGWGKSGDGGDPLLTYEKARIAMFYDNRIQYIGGKWLHEELAPSAEFRQLDGRDFRWESSTGPMVRDEEAPALRQVYLDYILMYYKLLALPTAILTHLGASNAATVASWTLGLSFAAETLVLVDASAKRDLAPGFINGWRLTYHFRFTPYGANKFWRADTQQYEYIYNARRVGGGRYIQHPLMNFDLLVP